MVKPPEIQVVKLREIGVVKLGEILHSSAKAVFTEPDAGLGTSDIATLSIFLDLKPEIQGDVLNQLLPESHAINLYLGMLYTLQPDIAYEVTHLAAETNADRLINSYSLLLSGLDQNQSRIFLERLKTENIKLYKEIHESTRNSSGIKDFKTIAVFDKLEAEK